MSKLIIISGPTASGKTKTSIDLAEMIIHQLKIPTVIVNFDSLLFYKEISIGSAKPSKDEQKEIEHFLIDIESIATPMNVSHFIQIAEGLLKDLFRQKKCVILVGGSAFYLRALLKGMYESVTPTDDIKNSFKLFTLTANIPDTVVKPLELTNKNVLEPLTTLNVASLPLTLAVTLPVAI